MTSTTMGLALMAFALAMPGPLLAAQADMSPEARQGHALMEERCSSCHAIEATGDSPNPTAPPFREIVTRCPVESLAEALAEGIIVDHDGPMPQFVFEPQDVDAILAYLHTLEK